MYKISFVCTTYRRYTCVTRIIEQYLQQDFKGEKELIIFNTDIDNPLILDNSLNNKNIIVINNNSDYKTGLDYENRGQILRDAVSHCTGYYFMLADDDDVYLPWHLRQAFDGIQENGKDAWKPQKSIFSTKSKIEIIQNVLEASVISKMDRIREIGFREDLTGYEGLSWYVKLMCEGQLDEYNKNYIPSYCFNWSDDEKISGHKQSAYIDDDNNFDNHKKMSNDISNEPLKRYGFNNIKKFYDKYFDFILHNKDFFSYEYYKKYFRNNYIYFKK